MFSRSRFGRASRMPVNPPSVPNTPNAGENTGIKTATVGDEVSKNPSATEMMAVKQNNDAIIKSMLGSPRNPGGPSMGLGSTPPGSAQPSMCPAPSMPPPGGPMQRGLGSTSLGSGQDQQIPMMKKGGKVKGYASGGSVRGSGCEQRGTKKWKVY